MAEKVIMSEEDIGRVLARIAHEVVERNRGERELVFIGVHTRGVPLARRLAAAVREYARLEVAVEAIDIGRYRDDLHLRQREPGVCISDMPADIAGKRLVLVDDVLFTGRSTRAAMDAIADLGRPEMVQLAVLVDRGHRELPIKANYVGKNVPSSRYEKVRVRLKETDGRDEVVIIDGFGEEGSDNDR